MGNPKIRKDYGFGAFILGVSQRGQVLDSILKNLTLTALKRARVTS
jgi:hypothetical protein